MARTITWVASVGVALAAFYACSTPPPALPRGGGASDDGAAAAGGTGGATGGLSGQLTGGVSGTGGKSAGGTGGGSAGGVGGAMGGSSGGVSTGGASGAAMGGTGGGLPQVGNRDSNFLNTGEQGCNNDTGCSGFVSPSPQGGTVLREYWGNIPTVGYPVDLYLGKIEAMTSCQFSPNFPDNPDSSDQMSKGLKSYQPFVSAQPNNYGDNYGERIRGYIKAPVTGNYTFWLTSDNSSMLFISTEIALNQTESTPLNARVRAIVDDYRPEGVFDTPGQKSQAVAMDIGKYYYFDLFHREWLGDDHWEVRWTRPDMPGTFETVPKEVLYTAVKIMGAPLSRNCPNATGGTSGAGGSGGAPSAAGAGGN